MRKNLLLIALGAGLICQAQDSLKTTHLNEVVVTGSKLETPIEKSGKMIYRISGKELAQSGAGSLADVLNKVPGVQMDGNFGTPGTNIDYFVRGAGSKRTLILIDGVPFNDPSGINLQYDLRLLDLTQVESVEVLRGGLSSLYGSGAAAAVINITLKKAEEGSFNGKIGMDLSSFKTYQPSLSVNGRVQDFTYLISGKYSKSAGFSAAKNLDSGDFDKDGNEGKNVMVNVGYDIGDNFYVEMNAAFDQFENEFDAFSYVDARNNSSAYQQEKIGWVGKYKSENTTISLSHFRNQLKREFDFDGFDDDYEALNNQSNVQIIRQLNSRVSIIAGLDLQKLHYEQPFFDQVDFKSTAPYLSGLLETGNFNLQVGGRTNVHSEYGSHVVYNVNPSYFFDLSSVTLKVLTNYSTSYVTPSLYQLYGPFGNVNLIPEESEGWDVGVSVYAGNGLEMNLVYFQRKDTNPMDFQSFYDVENNFIGGEYFNADRVLKVEGTEFDVAYSLGKIDFKGAYTWLNNLKGNLHQRVPRLKAGFGWAFNYSKEGSVVVNYSWTGKRGQSDPLTFEQVKTDAFGLVDLVMVHQINNFSINGAINNLLDEQYDAILGFNTIGRNYRLGLTVDFGK